MKRMILRFLVLLMVLASCQPRSEKVVVQYVGEMKNVMWKGELEGVVAMDSLSGQKGFYGLGPEEFLRGEILVVDGIPYKSIVETDSTMVVQKSPDSRAPFFVYASVNEWDEISIPRPMTIMEFDEYLNSISSKLHRPFPFRVVGSVDSAKIHIQNLPLGTKVSSPKEAHQGQVNYVLKNEDVEVIGFFSTEHQGIYTHHDSYTHMHLITKDRMAMGHLDEIIFPKGMKLYLPKSKGVN